MMHRPIALIGLLLASVCFHQGLSAEEPVVPMEVVPQFPHDQTLVPGRLYFRQVGLARVTVVAYHNGTVYTANVAGGSRRAWRFTDITDPSSLTLTNDATGMFQTAGSHGNIKSGIFFTRQIQATAPGVNTAFDNGEGERFPWNWQARSRDNLPGHSDSTTNYDYYPFFTDFTWSQYNDSLGWGYLHRDKEDIWQWDNRALTGITGYHMLLGNLMVVVSDQKQDGIVTLDMTPAFNGTGDPVVLDKLTHNADGKPLGGYLPTIWKNYILLPVRSERPNRIDVVDISDPRNLRNANTVVNPTQDTSRGWFDGRTMYIQTQDDHAFAHGSKFDPLGGIVMRFVNYEGKDGGSFGPDRPAGSVSGDLDTSQFALPLGNLLITGGTKQDGMDGVGVWAHQAEPDTRSPFVSYHIPRHGQTDFPRNAPVSLVINETLETYTAIPGSTILLRPVSNGSFGASVPALVVHAWNGVMTITPDEPLAADTTYELEIVAGGIKDAVGNGILGHRFRFSTGSTVELDDQDPSVAITYPRDGSEVPPTFPIQWEVGNWDVQPDGQHAHLFIDGVDQGPVYSTDGIIVSDLAPGLHTLRLALAEANHDLIGVDTSVSIVVVDPDQNRLPVAGAGSNQSIIWPNDSLALDGVASDPDENDILTVTWSQISGPSGVSFSPANAAQTTATFPGSGTYELQLSVSDGEATATDITTVYVVDPVTGPRIIRAVLVHADTGEDIRVLEDGDTILTSTIGTERVSIRAETTDSTESVAFSLLEGGDLGSDSDRPFAMLGNAGDGSYLPWDFSNGDHRLLMTPFGGPEETGAKGVTVTLDFSIARPLPTAYQESDGLVVFEGEHFLARADLDDPWYTTDAVGGFVGSGAVTTLDDGSTNTDWSVADELRYTMRIRNAGSYHIWMRIKAPDGAGNSAWVGIDGSQVGGAFHNGGSSAGVWQWVRHDSTVDLAEGFVDFALRRREDGFSVDRILLTSDGTYDPATIDGGRGPAESGFTSTREIHLNPLPGSFMWVHGGDGGSGVIGDDGQTFRNLETFLDHIFDTIPSSSE